MYTESGFFLILIATLGQSFDRCIYQIKLNLSATLERNVVHIKNCMLRLILPANRMNYTVSYILDMKSKILTLHLSRYFFICQKGFPINLILMK